MRKELSSQALQQAGPGSGGITIPGTVKKTGGCGTWGQAVSGEHGSTRITAGL